MDQTFNNANFENGQVVANNSKRSVPKNIKQIGKIEDGLKIYVEDYVKTYIRQIAEEEIAENPVAVLVGEYLRSEEERSVFIYGAIKVDQVWQEEQIIFSEETWTIVYEKIKKYFPDAEIAGWFVCGNDLSEERLEKLCSVHLDNFAGRDKVLFYYELTEKEEQFYKYGDGKLNPYQGYFIYYEKNSEMQGYMVEHKQIKREETTVEDKAVKEFRNLASERKKGSEETKKEAQQSIKRMMYLAGSVLTLVVLAVGVTAMKNQEKVKGLEETIHTISATLNGSPGRDTGQLSGDSGDENIFNIGGEEKLQGGNLTASVNDNENLSVETSLPGVTKLPEKDTENSNITSKDGTNKEKDGVIGEGTTNKDLGANSNQKATNSNTGKEDITQAGNTTQTDPSLENKDSSGAESQSNKESPISNTGTDSNGNNNGSDPFNHENKSDPVITGKENQDTSQPNLENGDKEKKDNIDPANTKSDNISQTNTGQSETPQINTNQGSENKEPENNIKTESAKGVNNEKETSSLGITSDDVIIYTVKSGDTLVGICKRLYGNTSNLQFIKEMNQVIDEDKIYEGQKLAVPKIQ